MACGSLAGIISKTGVFPLDVVRKRLQVQGPHLSEYVVSSIPSYSRENSVIGCMRKMIATEGIFSLYKGLVPGPIIRRHSKLAVRSCFVLPAVEIQKATAVSDLLTQRID